MTSVTQQLLEYTWKSYILYRRAKEQEYVQQWEHSKGACVWSVKRHQPSPACEALDRMSRKTSTMYPPNMVLLDCCGDTWINIQLTLGCWCGRCTCCVSDLPELGHSFQLSKKNADWSYYFYWYHSLLTSHGFMDSHKL